MNCNDCGGFLPRGCECSPFGGRVRPAPQPDPTPPPGTEPNYCNAEQCTCRMGIGYVACDQQPKWKPARGVSGTSHQPLTPKGTVDPATPAAVVGDATKGDTHD